MTGFDQGSTTANITLLTPGAPDRQIRALSLFQDQLFAGLTWPANENPTDSTSILKYDVSSGAYDQVTGSEAVEQAAVNENLFWQTGCHALAVFKRKADKSAALYTSLLTPSGCKLLITRDGANIETLPLIAEGVLVHALLAFNGYLFAAAYDADQKPVIYCSPDPVLGQWQQTCEAGFGDDGNTSITSMAEFNGSLYVATLNPTRGFQLWCTSANGAAPFSWNNVVTDGALRYTLNRAIMSMAVFNGSLYIGTGPFGAMAKCDQKNIAAAELIRVLPDNSWEIIVGSPRFSPYGLKVPMAAMGPGFDSKADFAITALAEYDGRLFAVTSRSSQANDSATGGFRIWSTVDGEEWTEVSPGVADAVNPSRVNAAVASQNKLILAISDSRYSDPVTVSLIKSVRQKSDKRPLLLRFAKSLLGQ